MPSSMATGHSSRTVGIGRFLTARIPVIPIAIIETGTALAAHAAKATHHLIADLISLRSIDNDRSAVVFSAFIIIKR